MPLPFLPVKDLSSTENLEAVDVVYVSTTGQAKVTLTAGSETSYTLNKSHWGKGYNVVPIAFKAAFRHTSRFFEDIFDGVGFEIYRISDRATIYIDGISAFERQPYYDHDGSMYKLRFFKEIFTGFKVEKNDSIEVVLHNMTAQDLEC